MSRTGALDIIAKQHAIHRLTWIDKPEGLEEGADFIYEPVYLGIDYELCLHNFIETDAHLKKRISGE